MRQVFLAGEGANELGDWHQEGPYRRRLGGRTGKEPPRPGVLETLLRKVVADGWEVVDAMEWKQIKKLRPGRGDRGDGHHVQALCLHARESGCDVVVFSRDRDGRKYEDRRVQVEAAIEDELGRDDALGVVGGMAIEKLEAWIVALLGERRSEEQLHPETLLTERYGIEPKHTGQMVAAVDAADLAKIPADAESLRVWLSRARETFE